MGYDYTIHYRTCKTSTVADALSRIPKETHASLLVHPEFIALKQALQDNPTSKPDYVVVRI